MIDKDLAEYIKTIVKIHCGIAVQVLALYITEHDNKMFACNKEEFYKRTIQNPIDVYNDYCKMLEKKNEENK